MYIKRFRAEGFRASAAHPIDLELPGRFAVLIGPNGAGKTTVCDGLYLVHPERFPSLRPPTVAALSKETPRLLTVEYDFEADVPESAFGESLRDRGLPPPTWTRSLERSLGRVRTSASGPAPEGQDGVRVIYLPAIRNPLEELAQREARILIELLRAEQQSRTGQRSLSELRALAARLLETLASDGLIRSVEERVRAHMNALSSGVSRQVPFVAGQTVDDEYLARVLEFLLGMVDDRSLAQRLEVSGLGYLNLLHIAVTLAAIPDDVRQASGGEAQTDEAEPEVEAEELLAQRHAEADSAADAFFPELFHVTVVIEEPESHLHPQLRAGLLAYLRSVVQSRPEIQMVISTHSPEMIAACQPEDLVVMRRLPDERTLARSVSAVPMHDRDRTLRMARLHLDGTRAASLFAPRLVLVEGVTDAILLRSVARAWASGDRDRVAAVESLTIHGDCCMLR